MHCRDAPSSAIVLVMHNALSEDIPRGFEPTHEAIDALDKTTLAQRVSRLGELLLRGVVVRRTAARG